MKKKVLLIGGTKNQTTMMYQIAEELRNDYHCVFTTFYGDNIFKWATDMKLLEMSLAGTKMQKQNEALCKENGYEYDYRAKKYQYDLVITCQDVVIPKNLKDNKIILVQEGTTIPKGILYNIVKTFKLPHYFADTAMTGMSDAYRYFCVASEGYKQQFVQDGAKAEKIKVTGIPNFDDLLHYKQNDFPHKNFILVATSNIRESYQYENRKKFLRKAKEIIGDKKAIFKLHPTEKHDRAIREIRAFFPESKIITEGNIEEMIANCDALITPYSTVVLVAAALGKKVYSDYYTKEQIKALAPVQNEGTSAKNIANLAIKLIKEDEK